MSYSSSSNANPPRRPLWKRLLDRKESFDVGIAILTLIVAGVAAYRVYGGSAIDLLTIAAAVGIAVLAILRAVVSFRQEQDEEHPRDLEGCLWTLYAMLGLLEDEDDEQRVGLRITVHVAVDDATLEPIDGIH
jgi:hypothetical protein